MQYKEVAGGICAPKGFAAAGVHCGIRANHSEKYDLALIKADVRYTQRALTVLPRLGFQVIVSAPESKTGEILEVSTKAYVTYKDPDTGLTSLREAVLHQNDMDDESSSDILKDDGVAE